MGPCAGDQMLSSSHLGQQRKQHKNHCCFTKAKVRVKLWSWKAGFGREGGVRIHEGAASSGHKGCVP